MALTLLPFRVLVTLDEGKTNMGVIVEHNLMSYPGLITQPEPPEDPEEPMSEPVIHNHIAFLENGAEEVTIGGDSFVVMHMHNILAYLED